MSGLLVEEIIVGDSNWGKRLEGRVVRAHALSDSSMELHGGSVTTYIYPSS